MNRAKHSKKRNARRGNKKSWILLASLALTVLLAVGGTLAYLMMGSEAVTNTFQPSQVTSQVVETFDGSTKTNVAVQLGNTEKDIPAFVRARIVVNWVKKDGNTYKMVPAPANYDYSLTLNQTDWFEKGGYYYHKAEVTPGNSTSTLIIEAKPVYPTGIAIGNAPYFLQVEILADAIQSNPASTVASVWPVSVGSDGKLAG